MIRLFNKKNEEKAKRAIFMAAGMGERMKPITLETPKPLVTVNGKRIIDGLIDAVIDAGIDEIFIVRGYLKEKFDILLEKYPQIEFVDNPQYKEANNISSILCVKDLLSNSYIFEADLLISNPSIIMKNHNSSDFLAIKKDKTDDWCFREEEGVIIEEKKGGSDCFQMVGISYWNNEDGKKLSKHIEEAFNMPGGKDLFWEQVPLDIFKDEYKVRIIECEDKDIVEIDTLEELANLDSKYKNTLERI